MSDNEQNSSADKSHEPTPQKLKKSREQGDVPYSNEATSAATYAVFFLGILILAGWITMDVLSGLAPFLSNPEAFASAFSAGDARGAAAEITFRTFRSTLALLALLAIGAIVAVGTQRSFAFSPSKIKPKLSRLSIVDNAKQKYGPNGLADFVKKAAKLSAIMGILLFAVKDRFNDLPTLVGMPANSLPVYFFNEAIFFIGLITGVAVVIGGLDIPWRVFQHRKRLRMTHEEVKRENKETEGDPLMKSVRRQKAEAIATNRMMADVPSADIVIVNPTHYATALKWDRERGGAPICVAKGIDEVAARIRKTAAENGVPIRRDPPTARSIYALVDIGQEIKREHFAAVAAAIHYADQVRKDARKGRAQ